MIITRSMSQAAKQQNRNMENNGEQEQHVVQNDSSSGSEGINNQLGLENAYDEMTPVNFEESRRLYQVPRKETEEEPERQPEVSSLRGTGQAQDVPQGCMDQIVLMFQKIQEDNKSMREENQSEFRLIREEINSVRAEMRTQCQSLREELKEEMKLFKDETTKVHEELRAEIRASLEDAERSRQAIKGNKDAIKALKSEVAKNKQQITTNTANLSENLNRINSDLSKDIRKTNEETTRIETRQQELEGQVEEKRRKIEEMRESQAQLTRRLDEVETRPVSRLVAADAHKEVTFSGTEDFPMEFLQELREIQQLYHANDGIRWVQRHLTGDATTWFRIIRGEVSTFSEFEARFINKFWSAQQQEIIRDCLEFRKYRPSDGLDPIQHMQKQILLCRQLVPPITDHHLIQKVAKNYNRDIELAVLMRGIKDISQFEELLRDYMKINNQVNERPRYAQPDVKREVNEPVTPQQSYGKYKGGKHFAQKREQQPGVRINEQSEAVAGPSHRDDTKNGLIAGGRQ